MAAKRGRKFTTWKYVSEDGQRRLDIPVRVVEVERDNYLGGAATRGTNFVVRLTEPEIDLEDTDIEALRKRVFAEVDAKLRVEWKPYLLIKTGGGGPFVDPQDEDNTCDEAGASLRIRVERYLLSETGGRKLHRCNTHGLGTVEEGWPTLDTAEVYGEPDGVRALVPDTLANRAAIDAVVHGMAKLAAALSAHFAMEKAAATLEALGIRMGRQQESNVDLLLAAAEESR